MIEQLNKASNVDTIVRVFDFPWDKLEMWRQTLLQGFSFNSNFISRSIWIIIKSAPKYEKHAHICWRGILIKSHKQKRIESEDRENCTENKRQMRYFGYMYVLVFQEMKIPRFRSLQRSWKRLLFKEKPIHSCLLPRRVNCLPTHDNFLQDGGNT